MAIAKFMTSDAQCISASSSITTAAQRLRDLDVGALPVCEGDRLVGIVTGRDLAVRGLAEDLSPATTPVREVMTPEVIFAFEDQDVKVATTIMGKHRIRRLPIMNRQKQLVGIVTLGDIAQKSEGTDLCGRTLKGISRPVPHFGGSLLRLLAFKHA